MLHICPSEAVLNTWEKASKFIIEEEGKLSCPLCLRAVIQIYNVMENNKTEVLVFFIL